MPGFYQPGEYDLSGTIVGVVDKSRMLEGKGVKAGDVVIGLASNGLHTNGYSLARKIFFEQLGLQCDTHVPELRGTLGKELLKVHRSYGLLIQDLLKSFNPATAPISRGAIKAIAHITGGGFIDNIPRMLPENCDVIIREGTWDIPPVFRLLSDKGHISKEELYHVFNMGVGMTLIVDETRVSDVLRRIGTLKYKADVIGGVKKGKGQARIE
jgi:phosphoribosylformylglycinamidine cyclo-ligase